MQGSFVLNAKAKKELNSLKVHIKQECLSGIPSGAGTNRNENLHSHINPFFRRCRMGIPLAVALLTTLFHCHNQKIGSVPSILSAKLYKAEYKKKSFDKSPENFGIVKKTTGKNGRIHVY